ncbi:hypothetical protein SLEP1_g26389 [Rubroshorea leprosula]|uniref:Uncharacterized protein n=1 Tax=Rubroshorea leprosula TaxID=152421 RepID=A0AAV5JW54_9ROSI|nr:hypothetical protein SLEP1_g26389 [Rubroshorea leprosula]
MCESKGNRKGEDIVKDNVIIVYFVPYVSYEKFSFEVPKGRKEAVLGTQPSRQPHLENWKFRICLALLLTAGCSCFVGANCFDFLNFFFHAAGLPPQIAAPALLVGFLDS